MTTRRLFRIPVAALALAVPALVAPGPALADGLPSVDKAWSRPTAIKVGVVYMRVTGGTVAARLTGARTPLAAKVEIHETKMKNGMMDMRARDGVDIPAGKIVSFKTGGLHLMLMGLRKPLTEGMRFPVTLRFGAAGERTIQVHVRRRAPE